MGKVYKIYLSITMVVYRKTELFAVSSRVTSSSLDGFRLPL
jgi:hypothetical protein